MERPTDRPGGAPLRAFRDRYAAPFVGVSYDLAPHCVGLHPDHALDTPEIIGRDVLISRDVGPRPPFAKRPAFRVVRLERLMRNAMEVGAEGGVVFSSFDLEDPDSATILRDLRVGEVVYLNAAVGRLPDATLRRPFFDEGDAVAS